MWLAGRKLDIVALTAMSVIALYVFVLVFGPWLAPYEVGQVIGTPWSPPSATSWFGTDNLGRDLLSRVMISGRLTVGIALACAVLSYLIGGTLGALAALKGGWFDTIPARFMEMLLATPSMILALVVLTSFQGTTAMIFIIAVLMSPRVFRLVRNVMIDIVAMDYIEVAKLRREGTAWIVLQEIAPNAVAPLAADMGLRICYGILFVSALSFLGFGVQPPSVDWGMMVRENSGVISFGGWAPLFPALAIGLLTVSVNLIVDWYQTAGQRRMEFV